MKKYKRLVIGIVATICFLISTPAMADQMGLGGSYVDGHSDSGNYGINNGGDQSWGLHFNYDKDLGWKHKLGKHIAIGLDPSLQLFYLHWTKQINKEEEVCEEWRYEPYQTDYPECWPRCHTEHSESYTTVHSLIAGVGPKAYFELGNFRLYGLAGVGYALQDGADDDVTGIIQGGVSYQFTKSFGMSLDHSEVYVSPFGEYDRFDVTSLNAVLFF